MPKKSLILLTLVGLSISTLGTVVPSFADSISYYDVSDLVPIHQEYAAEMETCGPYNRYDATFINCYNEKTDSYRAKYGGAFESMYQLDFNGRMVVSGINPTAGTIRLYIDETRAYKGEKFTFENLVAFWADGRVSPSPYWDDDVAWEIADAVLSGEQTPEGVHLLYSGKKGEPGWLTPNAENRLEYEVEGDFIHDNSAYFFFVLGYDSAGNKHVERNYYYGCANGDFSDGKECRMQFAYNGSSVSKDYVAAEATPEDLHIIELKKALKAAEEAIAKAETAETTAREAEAVAREAEAAAREAEAAAREAEAAAREAEAAAREAESVANEATASAREAEAVAQSMEAAAREAERAAREAESNAQAAEASARMAETRANELAAAASAAEEIARAAEIAAREAEASAQAAESRAVAAEADAKKAEAEAKLLTEKATKQSEEAYKMAEDAVKNSEKYIQATIELEEKTNRLSSDFTSKLNELNSKLTELSNKIATISANPTTIVTRTVEAPTTTLSVSSETNTARDTKTNSNEVQNLKTPDEYIELPLAGDKTDDEQENVFPWWIVAFIFSGIALTLWWFIPTRRGKEN